MKLVIGAFIVSVTIIIVSVVLALDSEADHGKEVYVMQKCSLCHSISGTGGTRMALDGVGSKLKPDDMKKWIKTPKAMKPDTTMKPYPSLLEKDLNDLTAYLTTLK